MTNITYSINSFDPGMMKRIGLITVNYVNNQGFPEIIYYVVFDKCVSDSF